MTRDEAIQEIQDGLGFTSLHTERIIRELKNAQERLENGPVRPWFLLDERAYTYTTADEYRVAVPTDFLEEYEEGALWYDPDNGAQEIELEKDELDFLKKNSVDETGNPLEGIPQFYALAGNYFWLFPRPDAVYKIRLSYFHAAAVLSSNIENDWLKYAPWLMIGEAGAVIAANARDYKSKQVFEEYKRDALLRLDTENHARAHANRNYVMGDGAL